MQTTSYSNLNPQRFNCVRLEDNHAPDLQRGHSLAHLSERRELPKILFSYLRRALRQMDLCSLQNIFRQIQVFNKQYFMIV